MKNPKSDDMQPLTSDSEQANRFQLVSRMADDLAHEIKNPLNSMVINLEVLRTRARKGDVDGALDRAAVLESEVLRLNGLVDGLLKLLRPERGGSAAFQVDALLDELGGLVGLQAKLARKRLVVHPIGENAFAPGPRDSLRFALLNILSVELQSITGEDAGVEVRGTTGDAGTIISIEAPAHPVETAGERDAAVVMARRLLSQSGGTVEAVAGSANELRTVTITLPKARSA